MWVTFIDWPESESGLVNELRRLGVRSFLLRSSQMSYELLRRIDDISDVIYVSRRGPNPLMSLGVLRVVKSVNRPVVIGMLEPAFSLRGVRPSNLYYSIRSFVFLTYVKLSRKFKNIHVLDSFSYRLLSVLIGRNIYYAPYGVETARCAEVTRSSMMKSNEFSMVFVHAEYRKGGDIVASMIPSLIKVLNDIKFIIILGSAVPSLRQRFLSLAREYKDRVSIYNFLPRDEFYRILSQSHVLLFPSRWEVFGRVVLDALVCGTPVVAFNIPGAAQDVVLRYSYLGIGRVAKPFDLKGFIRNVFYYYKLWKYNYDYYLDISKKAREIAMSYDYNVISKIYLNMFKAIIENS